MTKESVDQCYGKIREVKKVSLPFQKIELLGIDKKTHYMSNFPVVSAGNAENPAYVYSV